MHQTPPEGLDEDDFESIEAAVTETVRGRWFLNEYARRARMGEMKQMLDAMGRLEQMVLAGGRAALPAPEAALQTRLLAQRTQEISDRLEDLAQDLRDMGIDEDVCFALETQSRAVAALPRPATEGAAASKEMPQQALPAPVLAPEPPISVPTEPKPNPLHAIAALPLLEKLALFA